MKRIKRIPKIILGLSALLWLTNGFITVTVTHAKAKPSKKSDGASKKVSAPPLSPAQLKGQIIFLKNADVWAVDPRMKKQTLLFKSLFYSPDAPLNPQDFGGTIGFGANSIAFSPDCRRLAFTFYQAGKGGSELMLMNLDGSGRRRLSNTQFEYSTLAPRWSPDGEKLLYSTLSPYRSGGPGYGSAGIGIFDMSDTETKEQKTFPLDLSLSSYDPYWSWDSQSILFTSSAQSIDYVGEGEHPPQLRTARLDGSPNQPFDGDWTQFKTPMATRDGQFRFEADWQKIDNQKEVFLSLWANRGTAEQQAQWSRDLGATNPFIIRYFSFPEDGQLYAGEFYAAEAAWFELRADKTGLTEQKYRQGVFLLKRGDFNYRRLLAADCVLAQWL